MRVAVQERLGVNAERVPVQVLVQALVDMLDVIKRS